MAHLIPDPSCNRHYIYGINWFRRADSLILELDNDGIKLTASNSATLFAHTANGFAASKRWRKTPTAWPTASSTSTTSLTTNPNSGAT